MIRFSKNNFIYVLLAFFIHGSKSFNVLWTNGLLPGFGFFFLYSKKWVGIKMSDCSGSTIRKRFTWAWKFTFDQAKSGKMKLVEANNQIFKIEITNSQYSNDAFKNTYPAISPPSCINSSLSSWFLLKRKNYKYGYF